MPAVPIPIILYKNSKPTNHTARTLSNALQISGTPREEIDPFTPEITVEYNAAILTYNYCYIAEYQRYYYFDRLPTVSGKKIILHLHADSLYNFKSTIMRSQCIAERSSSLYDLMVTDPAVIGVAGYEYFERSLPYQFRPDQGIYILTVSSGGN